VDESAIFTFPIKLPEVSAERGKRLARKISSANCGPLVNGVYIGASGVYVIPSLIFPLMGTCHKLNSEAPTVTLLVSDTGYTSSCND
jgi:hypothetical protein